MRMTVAAVLGLGFVFACESNKRAKDQLEELQKKREAQKLAEKAKVDAPPPAPPSIHLDPPYDEAGAVTIKQDAACPEGFWSLLPGEAPGATPEEKKSNTEKRAALAQQLRAQKYLIKLRLPSVTLKPYDPVKGQFQVEVIGTIDCIESLTKQRIAIAWTDAKAGQPAASAVHEGADTVQNMWLAPPVNFTLAMPALAEAKEFEKKNSLGISARVAFTLGKAEVDKKLKRVAKVTEKAHGETLQFGGGNEDWGAGPLVRAELVGLRVATQAEKQQLFELRP